MRFAIGASETEKGKIESIEKSFSFGKFSSIFGTKNFHYRDDDKAFFVVDNTSCMRTVK